MENQGGPPRIGFIAERATFEGAIQADPAGSFGQNVNELIFVSAEHGGHIASRDADFGVIVAHEFGDLLASVRGE